LSDFAQLRKKLGPVGVWSFRFDYLTPSEATIAAQEIERLGYPSLWVPEVGPTEALSLASQLLEGTWSLTVANGIARMSDRSPGAAVAGHRYLQMKSGGRHILGLGLGGALSNQIEPLSIATSYLNEFTDLWEEQRADDTSPPLICLAAYGPKMSALAGSHTLGAHTYLANPEHTKLTRLAMGPDPVIAAEMAVVLTQDSQVAIEIGRDHLQKYTSSKSNQRKFKMLGFEDKDFLDGPSDRLVSELVTFGSDAIRNRLTAHRVNGADHVCIQVLGTRTLQEDLESWAVLSHLVL
jgi:probable F420-dependent oxidoreductase|tara:strand:- start:7285 stop:8166 length:882 start_codon:yes stop_codon:yes gene_type:complete